MSFIALSLLPVAPAHGENSAMVLEASSRAEVRRLADARRVRASVGLRLAAGDSIFVPTGASVTLLMRSGRVEQIGSDYVVPGADAAAAGLGRIALQPATPRRDAAGYFRPVDGAPVPIEPRAGVVVAPDNVALRWRPAAGRASYTVFVRRTDVPGHLRFRAGNDTVWTPPDAAFEHGVTYEWSVTNTDDGRPGAPVTFSVVDSAAWQQIRHELANIDALGVPAPARLLLHALIYRRESMLHEAARSFAALASSGAELSDDVRILYADTLDEIGDADGAAAIRERRGPPRPAAPHTGAR